MSKRYDRPDIRQMTKQWVRENCKNITDRDMGLLRTLVENKRRLLRRDQIERLYPTFASTDRLNKRLSVLYRMHVIDKIYPQVGLGEGSSKQHICLDRAGMILLDIEKYNKPIGVDMQGNRSLFLGWEHKVMLNEYECLIRSLVGELGGQILVYEVEEVHNFNDKTLIPDILVLIVLNGKGYLMFIEVDLGTENIPYVKDKFDMYKEYYMSKIWTGKEWAKLFKNPVFPRVLFFTEDGRSKRKITLQDYTAESLVRFKIAYHSEFQDMLRCIIRG